MYLPNVQNYRRLSQLQPSFICTKRVVLNPVDSCIFHIVVFCPVHRSVSISALPCAPHFPNLCQWPRHMFHPSSPTAHIIIIISVSVTQYKSPAMPKYCTHCIVPLQVYALTSPALSVALSLSTVLTAAFVLVLGVRFRNVHSHWQRKVVRVTTLHMNNWYEIFPCDALLRYRPNHITTSPLIPIFHHLSTIYFAWQRSVCFFPADTAFIYACQYRHLYINLL